MSQLLSNQERLHELSTLTDTGWTLVEGRDAIFKCYKFSSFIEAFSWMSAAALWSEKINHHPDMTVCEYNRVIVATTTHDKGGITDNDIRIAQEFESILETYD